MSDSDSKTYEPIQSLPDRDLRQIALDMVSGKVFTNWHLKNPTDPASIIQTFMPIALMSPEEKFATLKGVGLLYEYVSEAVPRSINGLPMFLSFKMLNVEDTYKVLNYYSELLDSTEEFLSGGEDNE